MSEVKVNKISPRSGTSLTIGDSGDTTNIVGTLQNNGAALVGDISSVVAGTNLSGGGTSGDVTINLADASTSAKGAASFSSDNFAASSGAITVKDAGIATAELQDNAVTTAKITDANVTTAKITDANVTTAKIADDAITLAKMAPGTDGNIISYDASGNPVAVATGSSGQVLTSAGAGAPPTFATIAGGLTEVDLLRKSANQAISASTASVVTANWERDDTLSEKIGNGMSESSGVFTFPSSGIYLIQSQMYLYGFGSGGAESAQYVQLLIQGTANNSSFVTLVDSSIPATANTGVRYVTNRAHTIFDCVDTSTHKVKFQVWIQGKSGTLYGSSSVNASFASFIKLGDT